MSRKSHLIIDAIRSGVYRPDDLIEVTHCPGARSKGLYYEWEGTISLLTVIYFSGRGNPFGMFIVLHASQDSYFSFRRETMPSGTPIGPDLRSY